MIAPSLRAVIYLGAVLALVGCGRYVGEDYSEGTLTGILSGSIRDKQNRYRIPAPRIAAVRRNTGIIREDSAFLVIVGPDLKQTVAAHSGSGVQYGVRLRKEPRTHFVLEKVWHGDQEIDLFEGGRTLRAEFPQFVASPQIPYADYRTDVAFEKIEPGDDSILDGLSKSRLLIARITVDKDTLPESAAVVALATDPRLNIAKPQFILRTEGCDWIVVKSDLLTNLMLDFLVADGRSFKGGVVITRTLHPSTREETGVGGLVRVRWMDLGGTLFYLAK